MCLHVHIVLVVASMHVCMAVYFMYCFYEEEAVRIS
jgi:hypothetical protein